VKLASLLVLVAVISVGWTSRDRLPFIGSSRIGSAASAGTWLVHVSDAGLLGGKPGALPATGATCMAAGKPGWIRENPTIAQAGIRFSFYDCKLRRADHTTGRYCVAGGGGGGQAFIQYTVASPGTCETPILTDR
jgi:hypothetical protein